MMPGGQGRLQMHSGLANAAFKYQQQQQQTHQSHLDHNLAHIQNAAATGGMGGPHQHAFSSGGGPQNPYNSPQHTSNGNSVQPAAPHWQEQLQLCQNSRANTSPHHHARSPAHRPGSVTAAPKSRKEEEEEKRRLKSKFPRQEWYALDFSGQGLRALSNALFTYTFLDKLFINHNKLSKLPSSIGKLKLLSLLDASNNALTELPAELGMLTNLRHLHLFDNQIAEFPAELGTLYQLETLGIEGNPLPDSLKQIMVKEGTKALITYLRENCPGRAFLPPHVHVTYTSLIGFYAR